MTTTYVLKQALRLGGERFEATADSGQVAYHVVGSFLTVPKTFIVYDANDLEVSYIRKDFLTFLPRFTINMTDGRQFYLKKKLSFFKDRYVFENLPLLVEGDVLDVNFTLKTTDGQLVATVHREIFRLTSTYTMTVHDKRYSNLVISLAVAIDYVELLENKS